MMSDDNERRYLSGERMGKQAKIGKPSKEIIQVNLKEYEFSPPGPMGWTAKEYEKMIDNLQNPKGE